MPRLALLFVGCLAAAGAVGSTAETENGFVSVFNGEDLSGWKGDVIGYKAEDGKLVADNPLGNLYTEDEYSDFVLRFEFKLTPGANNGVGLRVPMWGQASKAGMELQILDNSAEKHQDLKPYQYHGSIYGVVPAKRCCQKPVGEWNTQEVIAKGPHIEVIVNGEIILDADITPCREGKPAPDDKKHPGLEREKGHISLAGHSTRVAFRNLRIKRL